MHGGVAAPAINHAGRVHHQVAQRDRPLRRHLAGDGVAARSPCQRDLHIGVNFAKYSRQRIVDQQLPALVQLQRRERDHRLGHRRDVEDRVPFVYRDARDLVAVADRLVVDELAAARDRDHGAGEAALLDIGVDHLGDLAEPLRRPAGSFCPPARQRVDVLHDASRAARYRIRRLGHGLGLSLGLGWRKDKCRGSGREHRAHQHRCLPAARVARASCRRLHQLHGASSTCLQPGGRSAIVSGARGFGGSFGGGGCSTDSLNQ